MVNFGPLTAEIDWGVWAPQQISTGFASWLRYSTNVAQWRSTKLHDVWPSPRLVHYIYIFGGSCPEGIFPGAEFTLFCIQVLHYPVLAGLLPWQLSIVCRY